MNNEIIKLFQEAKEKAQEAKQKEFDFWDTIHKNNNQLYTEICQTLATEYADNPLHSEWYYAWFELRNVDVDSEQGKFIEKNYEIDSFSIYSSPVLGNIIVCLDQIIDMMKTDGFPFSGTSLIDQENSEKNSRSIRYKIYHEDLKQLIEKALESQNTEKTY